MDRKSLYSLIITVGAVFVCFYVLNMLIGSFLGEFGIIVSMFATIIFTLVYCTQLILEKLDLK